MNSFNLGYFAATKGEELPKHVEFSTTTQKGTRLFFLLIVILNSMLIVAQTNELRIGVYNDSWGGGFTPVFDDLRTFHLHASFEKKDKWKIESHYSMLTNRFDTDSSQRIALDEIPLIASFSVFSFPENKGNVWLKLGLVGTGDFFGSQVQKTAHELFGVTQTDLHYESKKRIYPSFGYLVNYAFFKRQLKGERELALRFKNELDYQAKYKTTISAALSISLMIGEHQVQFVPAYSWAKNQVANSHLLTRMAFAESGFNLNFQVFTQHVYYHFQIYPESQFSYGGVGLRLFKQSSNLKTERKALNMEIDLGVLSQGFGYSFKYSFLPFSLANRRCSVIVIHNYHTLLKKFIPNYPSINGHGLQLSAGLEIGLLKEKLTSRLLEPYLNASLGNKAITLYSKTFNIEQLRSNYFAFSTDAGVDFRLPIQYKSIDKAICFTLYHRLLLSKAWDQSQASTMSHLVRSTQIAQNLFGFGLKLSL